MTKQEPLYPIWNAPLYQQLAATLREAIKQGVFPNGRLPSERELGRRYGVTVIVVKWALDLLAKEGLVHRVPRKGTFVVGAAAGAKAARPVIYVTVTEGRWRLVREGGLYSRVLDIVREKVETAGYDMVAQTYLDDDTWRVHVLASSPLAAGVITFRHARAKGLRAIFPPHVPVVSVDHCVDTGGEAARAPGVSDVTCDNVRAASELTRHLLNKGHRRILFVGLQDPKYPTVTERVAGYRQMMEANGHEPTVVPLLEDQLTEEWWLEQVRAGFTAAIAYNDSSAVLAMNRLQRRGVRVPEDMSLACFDDMLPLLSKLSPPITAMAMPYEAMTESAWNLVLHPVEVQERPVVHPYRLIERSSVAMRRP